MASTNAIPLVLGSLLGVMVAILCMVLLLFYKKRKESIEIKPQIEKMTRGFKRMSKTMTSQSKKSSRSSKASSGHQQTPVLLDTKFWVPEVYNTIVQPTSSPMRKASRMQLDREIYSKVSDASYLQAADNRERKTSTVKSAPWMHELAAGNEPLNRGILHFSLQYKQDVSILYVVVLRAENLAIQKIGEACNPFVYVQVSPTYKRHMHSEVHQKTQNPFFNQTFEFEVSPYEVREQTVTLTVLDFNQEYNQWNHEMIGSVVYKLGTLERDAFFAGREFTLWCKLEDSVANDKPDGNGRRPPKVEKAKWGRN